MSTKTPLLHRFGAPHRAVAAVLVAASLVGCANLGGSSDPAVVVHQRAQQRWNALVAGQFDKAYNYLAPSFRDITPYQNYRGSFGSGAAWQAADVYDVKCEPERCEVKIRLQINLPVQGVGTITTDTKETWIQESGQWWLYQKP